MSGSFSARSLTIDTSAIHAAGPRMPAPDAGSSRLRVASIPASHVYVRHLAPEDGRRRRAPRRPAARPGRRSPGQWWPPVMLDAGLGRAARRRVRRASTCTSASTPRAPTSCATGRGRCARTARPLVYTVHDLRNPHHVDRAAHDAQLDVLVPAADALVTLTAGRGRGDPAALGPRGPVAAAPARRPAATRCAVARTARRPPPGRGDRPFRVGLHLKSLRRLDGPRRRCCPPWSRPSPSCPARCCRSTPTATSSSPAGRATTRRSRPRCAARRRAGAIDCASTTTSPTRELLAYLGRARRLGAALPLRHPLGLAGGVPRPRHDRGRADLRLLRRAGPGARLRPRRGRAFDAGTLADAVRRAHARRARTSAPPWPSAASPAARGRRRARRRSTVGCRGAGRPDVRICLVASSRFPIREPFAGGLEAMTHALAAELRRAAGTTSPSSPRPGPTPRCRCGTSARPRSRPATAALADVSAPDADWLAEHHAYLGLMLAPRADRRRRVRPRAQQQPAPPARWRWRRRSASRS